MQGIAIEGGRMVPSVLLALKLAAAPGVSVHELFVLHYAGTDELD